MISEFEPGSGQPPAGEYEATWDEICQRFGCNAWRERLIEGLAEGLAILAQAKCTRVWLNGSFGGEFIPNCIERASGKPFSEFFQGDRNDNAKGIVVIDLTTGVWS